MKLAQYDITHPQTARVVQTFRITPESSPVEVRHITLQVPDGSLSYVEGQSIGVLIRGKHEFGNPYHLRLYSIASAREGENGVGSDISICVRRCSYIDEVNGEEYPGVASNYLCDRKVGDEITLTGPYGSHFTMPPMRETNLLMVGVGTGIAPFRAFAKRIFHEKGYWKGKVLLFYGANHGLELLYMNDMVNDFQLYYDEETFQAFEAISPRPHLDAPVTWEAHMNDHGEDVWDLVQEPNTYVYVAGLESALESFNKTMIRVADSEAAWNDVQETLKQNGRWAELIY
ncbi:MAG: oxidoreductase [Candidatus Hydrogenedentes bacterium]|nr:oxidoreductase [Candidatus Hydrogenedentota bacterium]